MYFRLKRLKPHGWSLFSDNKIIMSGNLNYGSKKIAIDFNTYIFGHFQTWPCFGIVVAIPFLFFVNGLI